MAFVANNQASEILEPGKKAFNFSSAPIAAKLASVLRRRPFSALSMMNDHVNAASLVQIFRKLLDNQSKNALPHPLLEPPMACLMRRIS